MPGAIFKTGVTMTDLCGGIARPDDPRGDLCGEDPWCRDEPGGDRQRVHPPDLADRALLDALQDDILFVSRPFEAIAARLGMPEGEVILRLKRLQEQGIVRGVSPVLESRRVGLSATTLVALRVPDEKVQAVALLVNTYPEVSHNYRRDHPYSLWFTLAAKDETRIREIVQEITTMSGISEQDILELPTVRRFKVDVRFSISRCCEKGGG